MKVLLVEIAPSSAAVRAVIVLTARERRAYLATEQVVCYGLLLTPEAAKAKARRLTPSALTTWSWAYGPLPQNFEAELQKAAVDLLVNPEEDEGAFAFKQRVWHSPANIPPFEVQHLPFIAAPNRFTPVEEPPERRPKRSRAKLKLVKGTP